MGYCREAPYISPKSKKYYRKEPPLYQRTTTVIAKKKNNIEILKHELAIQRGYNDPKPTFQPYVHTKSTTPKERRTIKKFTDDVYSWQKKKIQNRQEMEQ